MANITPRRNKDGYITSYSIRVSLGEDYYGKKILKNASFKRPPDLTEKQAEREARRFADEFECKCRAGMTANINIKFGDYCQEYLKTAKITLQPSTYEYYTKAIGTLIIPALGNLKLRDITPVHIQQFVNMLAGLPKDKDNEDGNGETLSAATVRRYLTIVQGIFKLALKTGLIDNSPASVERLTLPKQTKSEVEIFTQSEVVEMVKALKAEPLQIQAVIYLDLFTGMRRGELVALKFSDIDFANQTIKIRRAAYKTKGEDSATKPPKDYETRTIDINQSCCELLKQMKADKISNAQRLGTKWVEGDWVFTQWNGLMMNPQTPTRQFAKFLAKNGLPHRKFHALRHTHATLMLAASSDIMAVKERLGHSSIETTEKYLHYINGAGKKAVKDFDIFLAQSPNHKADVPDAETEIETMFKFA